MGASESKQYPSSWILYHSSNPEEIKTTKVYISEDGFYSDKGDIKGILNDLHFHITPVNIKPQKDVNYFYPIIINKYDINRFISKDGQLYHFDVKKIKYFEDCIIKVFFKNGEWIYDIGGLLYDYNLYYGTCYHDNGQIKSKELMAFQESNLKLKLCPLPKNRGYKEYKVSTYYHKNGMFDRIYEHWNGFDIFFDWNNQIDIEKSVFVKDKYKKFFLVSTPKEIISFLECGYEFPRKYLETLSNQDLIEIILK